MVQLLAYILSDEVTTIKYYFEETSYNGNVSWTSSGISEEVATDIKNAYANSMKKWNDVCFYYYDSIGHVYKKKIINIVEGNYTDHNLTIYPRSTGIASTSSMDSASLIEGGTISHIHHNEWEMSVNVEYFYNHGNISPSTIEFVREVAGAHEMGHILGLRDMDNYCNSVCTGSNAPESHHHELLMGYGGVDSNQSQDITYKEIAGVAITRGFHTDNDHKWLNCGLQDDGTYKLICSICNGVKYVNSLSGITYNSYYSCEGVHTIDSGNMMAVASYKNKDYYKCKYCRYVAPFSSIVTQDYSTYYVNDTFHVCANNVSGLNYLSIEEHVMHNGYCIECLYNHTHSYEPYVYLNTRGHKGTCECGATKIMAHYVNSSEIINNRYARCLGCNRLLDLNSDIAQINSTNYVTINGSYILPNGIVVLQEADIEAYLNGSLQFYDINNVPIVD